MSTILATSELCVASRLSKESRVRPRCRRRPCITLDLASPTWLRARLLAVGPKAWPRPGYRNRRYAPRSRGRTVHVYSRPGGALLQHPDMAFLLELAWPVGTAVLVSKAPASTRFGNSPAGRAELSHRMAGENDASAEAMSRDEP